MPSVLCWKAGFAVCFFLTVTVATATRRHNRVRSCEEGGGGGGVKGRRRDCTSSSAG